MNKEINGNLGVGYRALEQYHQELKKSWDIGEERLLSTEISNILEGVKKIDDILRGVIYYANCFEKIALSKEDQDKIKQENGND